MTVFTAAAVRAVPLDLLNAVPGDALATVIVERDPNPPPESGGNAWAALTPLIGRVGGAPAIVADVANALAALRPHPWALSLLDAEASDRGAGSYRLARLQAALIVRTDGEHAAITRIIQDILSRWTTRDQARITQRTVGPLVVHTLTDARLPAWAQIQWGVTGPHGQYYVVTIGAGALAQVADTLADQAPSLADDEAAGALSRAADVPRARVAWNLRLAAVRDRLGPVMSGKPQRVLAALELGDADDAWWSVRRDGRALVVTLARRRGAKIRVIPISQALAADSPWQGALPDTARGYGFVPHGLQQIAPRAVQAWLASRRPRVRENVTAAWDAFEREAGVSIRQDLLAALGDGILVHDFPQHPANLPLAVTIMLPIEGAPDRVRTALDALLTQCAVWMGPADEASEAGLSAAFRPTLARLPDGVWTLRIGFDGPAVIVHDRWVILGYAPWAVRQNTALLDSAGKDAPQP